MKALFYIQALVLAVTFIIAAPSSAKKTENTFEIPAKYYPGTLKNLSQLYWALGRLNSEKDQHIDDYLMINECDLFKDYTFNEFEWLKIRELGRTQIQERMQERNFPVRFEFVQELKLYKYDFKEQGFIVTPDFSVSGIRRFEIFATDSKEKVCGIDDLPGNSPYYKGIMLELNRPVQFDLLPMSSTDAEKYLKEKTVLFKKLPLEKRKKSNIYNFRNIYLVIKVQFFANAGDHVSAKDGARFAKALAILESIEIFDDYDRTKLLHKQDYKRSIVRHKNKDQKTKHHIFDPRIIQHLLHLSLSKSLLQRCPETVPRITPHPCKRSLTKIRQRKMLHIHAKPFTQPRKPPQRPIQHDSQNITTHIAHPHRHHRHRDTNKITQPPNRLKPRRLIIEPIIKINQKRRTGLQ